MQRLNYIGSKFQLLEWLESNILKATGWDSFKDKQIADLFSGTGIVSWNFRNKGSITFTNDAELYSSIISHAVSISSYTQRIAEIITTINNHILEDRHKNTPGFITQHYSPYNDCERMFFTESR